MQVTSPDTVLYLIDELCGVGGAEIALLKLLRHLPRDRFRPLVATFHYASAFPAADQLTAPLHVFPLRRTYDLNALKAARGLNRLIRKENVRIVHTFFETSDLWGGLIARLSRCPVLVSSRRDMGIQRSWKHRLAYRALGRMFDQVQTVSDKVRDFTIRQDDLAPERVATVYTGVEIDADSPPISRTDLCRRTGIDSAARIVITIANVRAVKGIDVLIRSAARVCSEFPDVIFLVVGDTPDEEYFRRMRDLAASVGVLNRVHFWGRERDVASVLKAADVFALLSHSEGFSNALVEALACGLPCVVSDVGGNAEAVCTGRNGYIVARGDDLGAAERISELLRNPEQRRLMAAEARASSRRFNMEAAIEKMTACYEALLERSRKTRA